MVPGYVTKHTADPVKLMIFINLRQEFFSPHENSLILDLGNSYIMGSRDV